MLDKHHNADSLSKKTEFYERLAAEIKILSKKDPVPLDLLLRWNLVQQELSRMNINSLSLLDKTVQVTSQVMRMLSELLKREVARDDP